MQNRSKCHRRTTSKWRTRKVKTQRNNHWDSLGVILWWKEIGDEEIELRTRESDARSTSEQRYWVEILVNLNKCWSNEIPIRFNAVMVLNVNKIHNKNPGAPLTALQGIQSHLSVSSPTCPSLTSLQPPGVLRSLAAAVYADLLHFLSLIFVSYKIGIVTTAPRLLKGLNTALRSPWN